MEIKVSSKVSLANMLSHIVGSLFILMLFSWNNGGEKGKGQVKEHVQRIHGQVQWGGECLWEQGLDGVEESNGGKMRTSVTT